MPGKKGWPPHSCFRWKLTHITLHGGWSRNMQINRLQATANCRCGCCRPLQSLVAVQGPIPHWVWLASTASSAQSPGQQQHRTTPHQGSSTAPHHGRGTRQPVRRSAVQQTTRSPVCGVEGFFYSVSMVDVNVDVQHPAAWQRVLVPQCGGTSPPPTRRPPAPACAAHARSGTGWVQMHGVLAFVCLFAGKHEPDATARQGWLLSSPRVVLQQLQDAQHAVVDVAEACRGNSSRERGGLAAGEPAHAAQQACVGVAEACQLITCFRRMASNGTPNTAQHHTLLKITPQPCTIGPLAASLPEASAFLAWCSPPAQLMAMSACP